MRYLTLLAALLLSNLAIGAEPPLPSAWGKPVAELPKRVVTQADQLTVFADFGHLEHEGVPIYVVNRTAKPVPLQSQDGDVYLKLEYESAPGMWTRAESHTYSWCGNSYYTLELEPGRFVVVSGYRAAKGGKSQVRYRFYGQEMATASNAAEGLIDKAEVERAKSDAMVVQTGDFDFVRQVALGEIKNLAHRRKDAIHRLYDEKFDLREVEKVLAVIAKEKDEKLADSAVRVIQALKERGEQKK